MPTYRTAGAWGPGKGSNLTPAEVDANFYELRTDLDDLIANPPTADSVVSVSQSGFDLTFHTTLGNALGPLTMPVVQFQWRGEWQPFTLYYGADKFSVDGYGEFTVMVDHTSAATFDPDATGGSPAEALYVQTSGVGSNTNLGQLADVSADSPVAGQVLRYIGGSPDALWQPDTLVLDDLGDVSAAAPSDGDVLTYQAGSPTGWIAATPAAVPSTLDSLTDVSVPSPADGDFLRYEAGSPAGWINEAGTAISSLPAATLPVNTASLIEISEASGSPVTYDSAQIAISDLLSNVTLTDVSLAGDTDLPGNGHITAAGELGLLASPLALLDLSGTYTSDNPSWIRAVGAVASSATGQIGFNFAPTFNPSGASLSTLTMAGLSGIVGATALNITTLTVNSSNFTLSAGYSGVVTNASLFTANAGTLNGATITNLTQYDTVALANGNGATGGTVTNRQVRLRGITAGAAGGTLHNRVVEITVPSGGASSGTANNRGIFISGNGGTAAGGTVNNHAIYSDSTAMSLLTGGLTIGTTTLLTTSVALGNGAAAAAGTLTNAPAAGNPTKWIPINDNGTTRYIPAW